MVRRSPEVSGALIKRVAAQTAQYREPSELRNLAVGKGARPRFKCE